MDKEVSEVDRKLFLRKTYLDKIYYYINRNPINQEELYSLIRKFFGEYLKLDYEFTYEELSQELNKIFITPKVKEHIDDFLIRLSESEYLEETILGTIEINNYLEELGDIIKNIIYDDQPVHHTETIVQKVLKRHKEPAKVLDVSGISALIEETNFHITNGNIDIAKSSYINLLKAYDALSKDDKKKLHDDLNEVYERLQTLIKNPKSQVGLDKKTAIDYIISDSVKKVRDLADDTLYYINASNAESAKRLYSETLKLYESLNADDKKILHSRVSDLYAQLQAMLSVTIYVEDESASKLEDAKIGVEDEPSGSVNTGNNVALNLDLSELSPVRASSSASDISKADTGVLTGNSDANADASIINVDISAASDNLAAATTEDNNRFYSTDGNVITDFSAFKDTDVRNSPKEETDYANQTDLATKPAEEVGNVLFTPVASDVESTGTSKELKVIVPKTADLSKTSPISKTPIASTPKTSPIPESIAQRPTVASKPTVVSKPTVAQKPQLDTLKSRKDLQEKASRGKIEVIDKNVKMPSVVSAPVITKPEIQPSVDKLNRILKKIDDDMILDRFDKAKDTYKEALLFYRSMTDENKAKCYEHFYATFKKLDDALHQKSLHDILDKHLSDAEESHRPISLAPVGSKDEKYDTSESLRIAKMTTLPVMLSNDPDMTRVYELIEESYFNIDNEHSDLAMLKYFRALELYHQLPITDKKKLYSNLYELFKKLSIVKKI